MISLAQKSLPIDMLTVVEELRIKEELDFVGGPYYVSRLTNAVVSSANIDAHSRIVLQKFIQRELIRISGEIIGDAYEDSTDVFDLLDDAESKLFEITNNHLRKNFDTIDSVLVKTIQRIEDLRHKNEDVTGVPSGFAALDRVTYGWQNTDLIILAARPAVGKTAFALNLARNAVEAGARHLQISAAAEGDMLAIDIADDGPGLSPRARDNLFRPFFGSGRPGGSGLGLAIARELTRAQGGDLDLVRSTAAGTTFRLTLPPADAPAPALSRAPA
jgi:replicative DNA helicase